MSASAIIFVGPTLRHSDIEAVLPDAVCRPPAAQGDVYRAARLRPRAIGIIDGYFSGAPSVTHKEILWALTQGIDVYGSASMGALRAAELHAFGMIGVGRIFADYRDGRLDDDDEVAVVHGPAELGYPALSEPMVNMRDTIETASGQGLISREVGGRLVALAKSQMFARRTWPALFALARQHGLPRAEIDALSASLAVIRIDRKRLDALAMLEEMAHLRPPPARATFRFERTYLWDELIEREASACEVAISQPSTALVADELRLKGPAAYAPVAERALARVLAFAGEAAALEPALSIERTREKLNALRLAKGLSTREDLVAWLEANRLTAGALERLMGEEARLSDLRQRHRAAIEDAIADELRLSGEYEALADRANRKLRSLAQPSVAEHRRPSTPELRLWFFSQRLGMPVPHNMLDMVERLGFASSEALDACLLREWTHVQNETRVRHEC